MVEVMKKAIYLCIKGIDNHEKNIIKFDFDFTNICN